MKFETLSRILWTFVCIICVVPEPGSIRLKTKQTMAAGNGKIGMAKTRSITYHFFLAKKTPKVESGISNSNFIDS